MKYLFCNCWNKLLTTLTIIQFLTFCQWCTVLWLKLLWLVALHDTQKLSSTSREINILYGFTMKQDSSIWLLSLQILNYIYWNMTYCALSLYLNCILCCFPFSCLVNKLYRLWIKFQIKTFNANKIDSSHLSILCELNLCLDIDIFSF